MSLSFIAHRNGVWGQSCVAPRFRESELGGFLFACRAFESLHGVECDIRRTKDNRLIIHHDATLGLLIRHPFCSFPLSLSSPYAIRVCDVDYSSLRLLFVSDDKSSPILLDDFLSVMGQLYPDVHLYLELKEEGCEALLFSLLESHERIMDPRCHILSFSASILETCDRLRKEVSRKYCLFPHEKRKYLCRLGQNIGWGERHSPYSFSVFIRDCLMFPENVVSPLVEEANWDWRFFIYHYRTIRKMFPLLKHGVFTVNRACISRILSKYFPLCERIFTDRLDRMICN